MATRYFPYLEWNVYAHTDSDTPAGKSSEIDHSDVDDNRCVGCHTNIHIYMRITGGCIHMSDGPKADGTQHQLKWHQFNGFGREATISSRS